MTSSPLHIFVSFVREACASLSLLSLHCFCSVLHDYNASLPPSPSSFRYWLITLGYMPPSLLFSATLLFFMTHVPPTHLPPFIAAQSTPLFITAFLFFINLSTPPSLHLHCWLFLYQYSKVWLPHSTLPSPPHFSFQGYG